MRVRTIRRGGALGLLFVFSLYLMTACGGHPVPDRDGQVSKAATLISRGVSMWAVDHGDTYPPRRLVRDGQATSVYGEEPVGSYVDWPLSPYNGKAMRQGITSGHFQYVELGPDVSGESVIEKHVNTGCAGYRLVAYNAKGQPVVVLGQATWDEAFQVEIDGLQCLVQAWANDHRGRLPAGRLLTQAGLGKAYAGKPLDLWSGTWPINPYTGQAMHPGNDPGDYRYVRMANSHFLIVGFDSHGKKVEGPRT